MSLARPCDVTSRDVLALVVAQRHTRWAPMVRIPMVGMMFGVDDRRQLAAISLFGCAARVIPGWRGWVVFDPAGGNRIRRAATASRSAWRAVRAWRASLHKILGGRGRHAAGAATKHRIGRSSKRCCSAARTRCSAPAQKIFVSALAVFIGDGKGGRGNRAEVRNVLATSPLSRHEHQPHRDQQCSSC